MDDLLKSMKEVQSVKQLVQDVTDMCKSGGFSLTKFMSKSKDLLATIPIEKRKDGVKDIWRFSKGLGVRNLLGYRKRYVLLEDQFGCKAYNEKRFTINDKLNIQPTWFC